MATLRFRIKSTKATRATIYCRFSHGRIIKQEFKTRLVVLPSQWNSEKGFPKGNKLVCKEILLRLKTLEYFIYDAYFKTTNIELHKNPYWLRQQIALFEQDYIEEKKIKIIDYIREFLSRAEYRSNQKGGIGLSKGRIKSYITFKRLLEIYEKQTKQSLFFCDVDRLFFKRFTEWLLKRNYAINYVGKNITMLKTICKDAQKNGIAIFEEINEVMILKEKKKPEEVVYLSFEELTKIENIKLECEFLINARKWLLLGCYTGQRGGDLMLFHQQRKIVSKGITIIEWRQQKTGKIVAVPILPPVKGIALDNDLKPISLQKFGEYCKKLGKLAGLNTLSLGKQTNCATKLRDKGSYPKYELLSSHVCRRSFATNFYGIIPTPTLIQITGHSSEQMFIRYIGKTRYDHAEKMASDYDELLKTLFKNGKVMGK